MRRQIVKHGPGTLTVSLPAAWTKANRVKQGDEVEVAEYQGQLVVTPLGVSQGDSVSLRLSGPKRFIARALYNCYRLGYNEIRITFDSPATLAIINERVSTQLIGFEIVEQKGDTCVVRNVARVAEEEFDPMLRRMWDMQLTIAKTTLDAVRKNDGAMFEIVRVREKLHYKLFLYCVRTVNILGQRRFPAPNMFYAFITRLETLMDSYRYIAAYMAVRTSRLSKPTLSFFEDVVKYHESLFHLYYRYSEERLKTMLEEKRKNVDGYMKLLETVPAHERVVVHLLLDTYVQIFDATGQVYGLQLARTTNKAAASASISRSSSKSNP